MVSEIEQPIVGDGRGKPDIASWDGSWTKVTDVSVGIVVGEISRGLLHFPPPFLLTGGAH